jgi:hypothetical protein
LRVQPVEIGISVSWMRDHLVSHDADDLAERGCTHRFWQKLGDRVQKMLEAVLL